MCFHVGQLVVCVDDGRERCVNSPLLKGRVYTIVDIKLSYWGDLPTEALFFAEIAPPSGYGGFAAPCFRPVDETRIEVFKRIAASPRKRIEVEA